MFHHSQVSAGNIVCVTFELPFTENSPKYAQKSFFSLFFTCSVLLTMQCFMICRGFGSSFSFGSLTPLQGFLALLFCTSTSCFDFSLPHEPRFSKIMKQGPMDGRVIFIYCWLFRKRFIPNSPREVTAVGAASLAAFICTKMQIREQHQRTALQALGIPIFPKIGALPAPTFPLSLCFSILPLLQRPLFPLCRFPLVKGGWLRNIPFSFPFPSHSWMIPAAGSMPGHVCQPLLGPAVSTGGAGSSAEPSAH